MRRIRDFSDAHVLLNGDAASFRSRTFYAMVVCTDFITGSTVGSFRNNRYPQPSTRQITSVSRTGRRMKEKIV
jgi:hypothetical protein